MIAFLFLLHPLFSPKLSPGWDSAQYYLFADRKREVLDETAGKIIALVASLDALLSRTSPDRTGLAVSEFFISEAPLALNFINAHAIDRR